MSNILKMQKGLAENEQAMEQAIEAGKKQTKTAERTEQIPAFYNMGITSPEVLGVAIAEVLGEAKPIHKGTISTLITNIKETQPGRLTEPAEELPIDEQKKLLEEYMNQTTQKRTDTPQAPQKPQTAVEPIQTEESTPKEEKVKEKPNTKQKKQVFSFRATLDEIASWKAYATATGETMENVGTAAMNEYLDRHKLTGAEQAIFEAMKSKNEK